ncbi:coadhesin-like [Bolinopsis microptera]|uniref:coadhesin-like n=1 Tax=Bolinopsis microptera TaxID=2820187 RepID=UPI00307AE748
MDKRFKEILTTIKSKIKILCVLLLISGAAADDEGSWNRLWNRNVGKIAFDNADNAADFYRPQPQPVDGGWSEFGDWSECSVECGGGSQTRTRTCSNPVPEYGGANCQGQSDEAQDCNSQECPIDGGWSEFGDWSECSVECGGGSQTRTRTCSNPVPEYGGANCQGQRDEAQDCNSQQCPIDGGWSEFGDWSECSVECGGGSQTRTRTCSNPVPEYGGADCQGQSDEAQDCNTRSCPYIKLVVHCNDIEVLNTLISESTCGYSYWKTKWTRNVGKIAFASNDNAADFYRPQPQPVRIV